MLLDAPRDSAPCVCLVVCYFGQFPGWFHVYLLSCAYNPTIEFVIFTDQVNLPAAPPNVRFVPLTVSSFEALVAHKLGLSITLGSPRKVCDFKPLYGLLFEEHLSRANYWGYADLDVIYGDVRRFLAGLALDRYDVVTARREYLVGHFTLFRNNEFLRKLFQVSADVPTLLQSARVFCFDECGEQCLQMLKGTHINSRASCDSMTHVVRRLASGGTLEALFAPLVIEWPELRSKVWRLRWRRGRLWHVDSNREFMYFHFHAFKEIAGYRQPGVYPGDDALEISAHGITGCVVEQTV